jgi:DNA adenine methylase
MAKPFLKWPGGKQWLAKSLGQFIPNNRTRYFEPFLGGGSIYFHFEFDNAFLSDVNSRLIETYLIVRDKPNDLISVLSAWENDKQTYYRIREMQLNSDISRAAQFIYLNRTCWNGLYRVNSSGKFNVPFGNNGRSVFNPEQIQVASGVLQSSDLSVKDFQSAISDVRAKDLVYFDPPYVLPNNTNGFRRYNKSKFTWSDQQRLARLAIKLADIGCYVIISNAISQSIIDLYPGFNIIGVERNSNLAADVENRGKISEALILSFPISIPEKLNGIRMFQYG